MSRLREPAAKPQVLLTIAGFDPSSGAGATADLQVFAAHGMFGTAALTALTVQSTRGVTAVHPADPSLLRETLLELQADMPAAGVKIGMLGSAEVVRTVAEFVRDLPQKPVIVLDPVLCSSSGRLLLEPEGVMALQAELLPLVDWITPNWSELAVLAGSAVETEADVQAALALLGRRYPCAGFIATGGDRDEPADLLRTADERVQRVPGKHVETTSTHGTGCAFSSALLCELVAGLPAAEAVVRAKQYVEGALRHASGLGNGRGPMNLLWSLRESTQKTEVL